EIDFLILLIFGIFIIIFFLLSLFLYEKKVNVISKDIFKIIVDTMPSQVYVRDVDGNVIFANKAHLDFLNVEYKELINKNDVTIFSKEEVKQFREEDIDVINNRKIKIIPQEKVIVDNNELFFKTIKKPVKLYNDKYYSLGISYNITELVSSKIDIDNKNEELSASMQQLEAYSQVINSINMELNTTVDKFNLLIETVGEVKLKRTLTEDEFLKELFNVVYNLIEEADYGSIYVYKNDEIHFAHCIGHNKDALNELKLNKDIFSVTADTFKIVDYVEESSMNNMTEGDEKKFLNAIKKTKQAILIGLHFEGELIGGLSLETDIDSNKKFSNSNGQILHGISQLINDYFINSKYQYLKDNLLQETVKIVVNVLNIHDEYTKNHSTNVANYSRIIAKEMKFDSSEVSDIFVTGILHDIGKALIPIEILNKTGKLSDSEFNILKTHPKKGYDILSESESLNKIAWHILFHHERWDGKGYPSGIGKDEIPVISQIISVADAYDAMTSDRPYRKKFTKEYAVNEIIKNSGTQFSPVIVEVFKKVYDKF
ncbi:MAG: HD domain-containing protein, partial [Bacillota bacterium]|nr:HD domain-containing protein [Bacillota bacterium]